MKNIKKYFLAPFAGLMLAFGVISCTDQLRDEFYNPDKITEPDFNLFFTSALMQGHLFRYDYGATYHYMRGFGKMLGLGVSPLYLDASQNNAIVEPWTGWSGIPFNEFVFNKTNVEYSKDINAMKLLYANMNEEDKAKNRVFIACSDIVIGYAFQRSADLYDDIPYFEVGGAFQEKFYARYDTQEEIYTDIMAKLKAAAAELGSYTFATEGEKIKFASADLLCKGNIDQWIRMANSLRLRMAMRLCHVKPDVTRETIKELLSENRMLTEYTHNIGFEEMDKTHAFELTFYRGLDERGYECGAPATIMEDILGYHYAEGETYNTITRHDFDPRLYAIFQPDIHGRYIGLPLTMEEVPELSKYYTDTEIDSMFNFFDAPGDVVWSEERIPAMYNRKTFFNFDMKYPVMHSTETNLLLVEAAVRWPGDFGSINIAECISKAIESSTRFYYEANTSNNYSASTTPSVQHIKANASVAPLNEEHLVDYCNQAVAKFNTLDTKQKLKFIFDQKFVDMNVMNPYEIYSEARRLVKDFDGELPFVATPNVVFQERMYYPTDEAANNPDNFATVAAKNNHTTPVWWTGRTETAVNRNGDKLN